jgi:hypothetical protein
LRKIDYNDGLLPWFFKVLLNAAETQKDVSDNLMDFFQLIRTGKGNTALSKRIAAEVEKSRQHTK